MKKDYSVPLFQLDRNLASDVSTRCSGRPQGQSIWSKRRKLSSYQVESREQSNLSSKNIYSSSQFGEYFCNCIVHKAVTKSTTKLNILQPLAKLATVWGTSATILS